MELNIKVQKWYGIDERLDVFDAVKGAATFNYHWICKDDESSDAKLGIEECKCKINHSEVTIEHLASDDLNKPLDIKLTISCSYYQALAIEHNSLIDNGYVKCNHMDVNMAIIDDLIEEQEIYYRIIVHLYAYGIIDRATHDAHNRVQSARYSELIHQSGIR